jgi:hypothetical protein
VQPDRPQMIIQRMCIERGISKTTNTHSDYVLLSFSLQQWSRGRAPILRYTCIACLVTTYYSIEA